MGWCQAASKMPFPGPLRVHMASNIPPAPQCYNTGPRGQDSCQRCSCLSGFMMEPKRRSDSPAWSFTLVRAGQDPGEDGQGLKEKTLHLRFPLESGKHLDFLAREGCGSPTQFFLVLGVSYFLLLEYHNSRGTPIEGRVMTPKAAQSRKWGENLRSNSR